MMSASAKEALQAAFLRLLEERPLREITVKDIVQACGVNRNTFYYHFKDIPALLEELSRTRRTASLPPRARYYPWRTAWRPPPALPWSTDRRCFISTSPLIGTCLSGA